MAELKAKDRERLEQLRDKLLDEHGDYCIDADFEELQELAKLEAKADDKLEPKAINPNKGEVNKEDGNVFTTVPIAKTKAPKIVRPWLKKGFVYCGVDKNGTFILRNEDEGLFYRLNRDPNFVDALGEGLTAEYLEGLK